MLTISRLSFQVKLFPKMSQWNQNITCRQAAKSRNEVSPWGKTIIYIYIYILGLRWLSFVCMHKIDQSSTGKDCNQLHRQKSHKWQLGWCGDIGLSLSTQNFWTTSNSLSIMLSLFVTCCHTTKITIPSAAGVPSSLSSQSPKSYHPSERVRRGCLHDCTSSRCCVHFKNYFSPFVLGHFSWIEMDWFSMTYHIAFEKSISSVLRSIQGICN